MGWTIHSTLTGGIQSGMPITQAPIKLSETILDQSFEEEEKTGLLDNLEGKQRYKNSTSFKINVFVSLNML